MKRSDLIRQIAKLARERGLDPIYKEGANHTRVSVGQDVTFIPRHREIDERLARAILTVLRGK